MRFWCWIHPLPAMKILGEGPSRSILMLIRDSNGPLHKATENDKIVPCAQHDGIAGDPLSYIQITQKGVHGSD